jgi:fumarate reductase flavoprotein subunit
VSVEAAGGACFEVTAPVVVIGAGACGLSAALAVAEVGCEVVVLERDPLPQGSTALSSGMIPACGTLAQGAAGVEDSPRLMAGDIRAKARGEVDEAVLRAVCEASGPCLDWLVERHGVELSLVEGFLYPGHRRARMHAPPSRTGAELIGALTRAASRAGVGLVTGARVQALLAEGDGRVRGLRCVRPDGTEESLGCDALVLACNGFGGSPELVRRHIPEMADAVYFGHPGNQGDALRWGGALGAASAHLGAFQGHGSVAQPHGILVTWALMMEGGIQVNERGERFSNEHDGYSEQARRVAAQPRGIAWDIYDARLHRLGLEFEDYRHAVEAGAVRSAEDAAGLARVTGLPPAALARTVEDARAQACGERGDPFGRDFTSRPALEPPLYAVRVGGALFHTQGGLIVGADARVQRADGSALPNLLAAGGAACGLSGPSDWGYLSGNGLLTAIVLGRIAGRTGAGLAAESAMLG